MANCEFSLKVAQTLNAERLRAIAKTPTEALRGLKPNACGAQHLNASQPEPSPTAPASDRVLIPPPSSAECSLL